MDGHQKCVETAVVACPPAQSPGDSRGAREDPGVLQSASKASSPQPWALLVPDLLDYMLAQERLRTPAQVANTSSKEVLVRRAWLALTATSVALLGCSHHSDRPVGYLGSSGSEVAYVSWTASDPNTLSGSLLLAEQTGIGTGETVDTGPHKLGGTQSGDTLTLHVDGLGDWSGTLRGDDLSLQVPQRDGTLHVACQLDGTTVLPRPKDHPGRVVMLICAPWNVNADSISGGVPRLGRLRSRTGVAVRVRGVGRGRGAGIATGCNAAAGSVGGPDTVLAAGPGR